MIKENTAYNEDCLDTMARMPDEYIDLTVTSPPYDEMRDYKGFSFEWQKIISELFRVTKQGGVVVWVVGDQTINGSETGSSFRQALYALDIGFKLYDTMIYKKTGLSKPENTRYHQCFEYMFVWSKGIPKTINRLRDRINRYPKGKCSATLRQKNGELKKKKVNKIETYGYRWNIWEYNNGWGHSYKEEWLRGHPAIFPEQLARDHVVSWSAEGDLVYDPFLGSGTTAKVAILNNRRWIGSEISEEYFKLADKRIKYATNRLEL